MRRFQITILLLFALFVSSVDGVLAITNEQARDIVALSDGKRVPGDSFGADILFLDYRAENEEPEQYELRLYAKGTEKSVVRFYNPVSERGKAVLMVDDNCWIYMPSVKKPVRVSVQQRLVGQISNADAVNLDLAQDYTATYLGDEIINGDDCYKLELEATKKSAAYKKLHYYVRKADSMPIRIEYFALSGTRLKIGDFTDFKEMAGMVRPTTIVLTDAIRTRMKTSLTFLNMTELEPPEYFFNKSRLDQIK